MMRYIIMIMVLSALTACNNRTADKTEREFENPFGYFSIVENNEGYSVSVDQHVDKQTFEQHFKSGSYWIPGDGYEVSVNCVDNDPMVSGGTNYWSVLDNMKITSYGGVIMSPISIHTYDYSFDNGILSIGEDKFVVCYINDKSIGLVEEAYLQDGTPRWIYYEAHTVSKEDFNNWYENASKW